MDFADVTLAAFTLCNSVRVLAYLPQVLKAAKDDTGARAISQTTWSLFLVSHLATASYALVNMGDWAMGAIFLGNAAGSAAILLAAAWRQSQYRKRSASRQAHGNVVPLLPGKAA
jgi:hypothetical protein